MVRIERLGIASRNPHKIAEIQAILDAEGVRLPLVTARDLDIPPATENGATFLENAVLKARHYARFLACPTLADDSGLLIPHLQGFPGLHSARWAAGSMTQAEKNRWIVERMRALAQHQRYALFVCALAFVVGDEVRWSITTCVEGWIADQPRGDQGFGYDPIFFYPPLQLTFAELPGTVKNQVSHRAQAFRAWARWFRTEERRHDG